MALQKAIKQENGVVLNYHRIKDVTHITNKLTKIHIVSYIDEEERQKELVVPKDVEEYLNNDRSIYMVHDYIVLDYDDSLTIENSYNYVKTTEKYKDSVDV